MGEVDRKQYGEMIDDILGILSGNDARVIASLERKMNEASEALLYEDAAKYRDYIKSLRAIGETQRASMVRDRDVDVLLPILTLKTAAVAKYRVRDGKLVGREITYVRGDAGSEKEILATYTVQHYQDVTVLPREILLPFHVDGRESLSEALLEEFLNDVNEENAKAKTDILHKTKIIVPERGDKKALLDMAIEDSLELVKSLDDKAERERERKDSLRKELSSIIEYASAISGNPPILIGEDDDREYRVEAYDISNFNGLDTVGAMVVYEGRKAIKNDYRKFKIRTSEGDDYGSLREVIYRRLKRARNGDSGFTTYPDIMFIDGGLGQVHAVKAVVDAFRIAIPVVGLAKDDSHRTLAIVFYDVTEIDLRDNRLLFSYCSNIQEEVHRFAITYMSGVKGKKMIHSVLEDIPDVGPSRRKALLAKFGGIDSIKRASYEELMEVEGINSRVAENIVSFFSKTDSKVDPT